MKVVDLNTMELIAWVGADEFDGSRGIKAAMTPVGWVPLAFKGEHLDRAMNPHLLTQLQAQATQYDVQMHLAQFQFSAALTTLNP